MSMIKIENLTFSYPTSYDNVFENVSFQVDTDWKLVFMRRAARCAFQIVPLPASHFSASASLHSTQCRGRNSRHAGGAAV